MLPWDCLIFFLGDRFECLDIFGGDKILDINVDGDTVGRIVGCNSLIRFVAIPGAGFRLGQVVTNALKAGRLGLIFFKMINLFIFAPELGKNNF